MKIAVISFSFLLALSSSAKEIFPELECPNMQTYVIGGGIIGAALVYGVVAPNVPQPNGVTFLTAVAVGGLAGGFTGAVFAQRNCRSQFAVTANSLQLCWDF